MKLWNRIKNILWEKWDPIGVYESNAEWDDEYDSYVPHIFRLAIEGQDQVRIANSLSDSATLNMGLSKTKQNAHEMNIAKLIIEAKIELLGE